MKKTGSKRRSARKSPAPKQKRKAPTTGKKKKSSPSTAAKKSVSKAKPVSKTKTVSKAKTVNKATVERRRLRKQERELRSDVENEPAETSMSDSPEYMKEAMEDSLAEELGEAAVSSETSGDQEAENIRDEDLDEEEGGPFVETSAEQEFAAGTDGSNPADAERETFPTANAKRRR